MFLETQLRLILGLPPVRINRQPPKEEKIEILAKRAFGKNLINRNLLRRIIKFNESRNNAVHNLAMGQITFNELETVAKDSSILIHEMQNTYAVVQLGPEIKIK